MPTHTHSASADVAAGDNTTARPGGAYLANTAPVLMYSSGSANLGTMSAQMVTSVGGSEAHENRQPYLTLTFCIALAGIFPSGT
jgi:microcystin-dependent protein